MRNAGHDRRRWLHAQSRHALIPGGAHTYSRGDDQYPSAAPPLLARAKGPYVWDLEGRRLLDWGMGLRSVTLGYADERVDEAVVKALGLGVNLSRPVPEEFELAELMVEVIPNAEMVKFGKNGSDATAAAIRLARAYTRRSGVLRCRNDPFLGVHDWFIGSTVMNRGIPDQVKDLTRGFEYGDDESVRTAYEALEGDVAAIILEPAGCAGYDVAFLRKLREHASDWGCLLIFDETITGFRFSLGGVQQASGVAADLATFGKGMSNGFAISSVTGRRDIMELGGIQHDQERVFLMSSTYGSERVGLAAAQATIEIMDAEDVPTALWRTADVLVSGFRQCVGELGLDARIKFEGLTLLPKVSFLGVDKRPDPWLKALVQQEMVSRGVLVPPYFMSVSQSHGDLEVEMTLSAFQSALEGVLSSIEAGTERELLVGDGVHNVFRRFNEEY